MAVTFLQLAKSATDGSSFTFSAQNLGVAAANRYICCTVNGRNVLAGAITINSVTIGGVTATINAQVASNNNVAGICIANVPTGATGDVVVTFSDNMTDCNIALYREVGVTSTTATDSGTSVANPLTYDIDINAGGFAVAIGTSDDGAATATWAGLTERFDEGTAHTNDMSGSSDTFAGAQTNLTVSCTWTSSIRPTYAIASYNVASSVFNKDNMFLVL